MTFPPGEHGLAPFYDEDDDEMRCPVCGTPDCQEHLVATVELDEGVMGGCLYDDWAVRRDAIDEALREALLRGRGNPEWPSELASIFDALHQDREQFVIKDEDTGEWIIDDDAWSDACCEINSARLLLDYLEEWLSDQPGTDVRQYEISTAPGLTWVGTMVYAADPEAVRQCFLREFCVAPASGKEARA